MSHARIEEVSDSDPSEGDISDAMSDFDERDVLKVRPSAAAPASKPSSSLINPSNIPSSFPKTQIAPDGTQFQSTEDDSKYKDFQCIYPVYFDKKRSRKEGRMVGRELAVENPLAREIVNACGRLRLETLFEPSKTHPKDWANPGRVKVRLRGGNNSSIKNKHHLYTMIAEHLRLNPTTATTAQLVKVPGIPPPDASKPYPTPAVPKGWKMSTLLPYYSPAITGGGVSENFFKDMMAEMQGAGGAGGGMPGMPGMPGMGGGGMPDMSAMQAMLGGMGGMGGLGNMLGGGGGSSGTGGSAVAKKDKKKKK